MRADRLVSLVLLLRQRGRMTANQLAHELEVSARTVLRDIDALSTAGVPVYSDRGRHGGFSLLPGFRTELTGLNHDEALALLTAGSDRGAKAFGLSAPLASAMRKVVDALPEGHRLTLDDAAKRFLVEPETDLLSRRVATEDLADGVMSEVRDRTYRLSRMVSAEALPDPAQRPAEVDLDRIWAERSAQFLSEDHIPVVVRVRPTRRDHLLNTARAVRAEQPQPDGWVRLDVTFEDLRHAVWAVWQLGTDVEVIAPESAREAIALRATALLDLYQP